ncbi:MAG: hypothetical protein HUK02_01230 [Bacteroidaceae bacterium]|nr:hypothetical protein [Bacteroidaceae bacterium]
MKVSFLPMATVGFAVGVLSACAGSSKETIGTSASQDAVTLSGFLITADLLPADTPDGDGLCAGKVCVLEDDSAHCYRFEQPDVSETLVLEGDRVAYYRPAQDEVPPQYVSMSTFEQASHKVTVTTSAPAFMTAGTTYTYKAVKPRPYVCSKVTVKPIQLSDSALVLNTYGYDREQGAFVQTESTPMTGRTVYELTAFYEQLTLTTYFCNNVELDADLPETGENADEMRENLHIDATGRCFSRSSDGMLTPLHALKRPDDLPNFALYGWIGDRQFVLNASLYELEK